MKLYFRFRLIQISLHRNLKLVQFSPFTEVCTVPNLLKTFLPWNPFRSPLYRSSRSTSSRSSPSKSCPRRSASSTPSSHWSAPPSTPVMGRPTLPRGRRPRRSRRGGCILWFFFFHFFQKEICSIFSTLFLQIKWVHVVKTSVFLTLHLHTYLSSQQEMLLTFAKMHNVSW